MQIKKHLDKKKQPATTANEERYLTLRWKKQNTMCLVYSKNLLETEFLPVNSTIKLIKYSER